jgi:hypothetical protein
VLVLVALASPAVASKPGDAGGPWKFDIVHLKNGLTVQGLLLEENPGKVVLLPIHQRPGEPTAIGPERASYLASEVERIEKLEPLEHDTLVARLTALRSRNDDKRMQSLKLRAVAWPGASSNARAFDGGQFVLISDVDEKSIRRVAVRLLDIYAAFTHFLPPRVASAQPTTIYLYRSLANYHESLEKLGKDILNPAFYDPQANQILWGSDLSRLEQERESRHKECQEMLQRLKAQDADWHRIYHDRVPSEFVEKLSSDRRKIESAERDNDNRFRNAAQDFYRVLYHEAFHAYLANYVYPATDAAVPRWLNEGLAQIFENAIIEAGELRVWHVGQGGRLFRVKSALQRHEFVPLADLLRSGSSHFLVVHADAQRLSNEYYLASWALSFYLTFELKKIGTPEMDQYVRSLLQPGTDPVPAFERFVDRPLEEFEKQFHAYLRRLGNDGKRN